MCQPRNHFLNRFNAARTVAVSKKRITATIKTKIVVAAGKTPSNVAPKALTATLSMTRLKMC